MKKYILFLIIVLIPFSFAYADSSAKSEPQVGYALNPYQTVRLHLLNLDQNNYNPDISAKALNAKTYSWSERRLLAIKLKKIFDGKGLFIDFDEISKNPDYKDTLTKENKLIIFKDFPKIYLEKDGKYWYYSRETVAAINDLYNQVNPFGISQWVDKLPDYFHMSILYIELWQLLGIIIFAGLGYLLYKLLSIVFKALIDIILHKVEHWEIPENFIISMARPFSLLAIFIMYYYTYTILELPLKFNMVIMYFLKIAIPLTVTIIVYRSMNIISVIFERLASRTKSTVDDQLVPFLRKTLKGIVIIIGFFYILKVLDVDITPLLAGVSIGGLALALAAQETVKNLLGSVTIFIDQPFALGDWIIFSGGEGVVEEVGLRSTRIRTFNNSLISIPNGKLGDMMIDNMGRREYRRFNTSLSVRHDTPPDVLKLFIDGMNKIAENHPNTKKDSINIWVNNFTDYSVNVYFNLHLIAEDFEQESLVKQEIIFDVLQLAHTLGVKFAHSTQALHIEDFPDKTIAAKQAPQNILEKYEEFMRLNAQKHQNDNLIDSNE